MNPFKGVVKSIEAEKLKNRVKEELRKNGRVPAIRMYRIETKVDLKQAIKYVDAL